MKQLSVRLAWAQRENSHTTWDNLIKRPHLLMVQIIIITFVGSCYRLLSSLHLSLSLSLSLHVAQNDFPAGEFYIDIEGGDKACANADKRISTRVSLVCDPFAIWTHRNLSSLVRVTKQPDCVVSIVFVCNIRLCTRAHQNLQLHAS